MLKHYVYAVFSELAYKGENPPPMPKGWSLLMYSPGIINTQGYFGAAFINTSLKEVVIAHRGTVPGWNFYQDFLIWLEKVPTQFINSADPFTGLVKEKLSQEFPSDWKEFNYVYTGHSLGATLAELSAARELKPGITFESPGSLAMIQSFIKKGVISSEALDFLQKKLVTYNTSPNAIDTTNRHPAANIVRLYPELDFKTASCEPNSLSFIYSIMGPFLFLNLMTTIMLPKLQKLAGKSVLLQLPMRP